MDKEEKICLEVIGPTEFSFGREKLSLIFWWERQTEVKNYNWVRVLIVGLRWPPWKYTECFMETGQRR